MGSKDFVPDITASAKERLSEIDWLRGLAVLGMVIFHANWNAWYFGLWQVNPHSVWGRISASLIASTFLLVVGVCFHLGFARSQYSDKRNIWRRHLQRGLRLLLLALGISIAVHFAVEGEIWFGILHLIAFGTLLAPLVSYVPRWAGVIGTALILLGVWSRSWTASSLLLLPLGGRMYPILMLDYYPLLPWLGVIAWGIALGRYFYPNGRPRYPIPTPQNHILRGILGILSFCGRHALTIYVVHQPLLFVIMRAL